MLGERTDINPPFIAVFKKWEHLFYCKSDPELWYDVSASNKEHFPQIEYLHGTSLRSQLIKSVLKQHFGS